MKATPIGWIILTLLFVSLVFIFNIWIAIVVIVLFNEYAKVQLSKNKRRNKMNNYSLDDLTGLSQDGFNLSILECIKKLENEIEGLKLRVAILESKEITNE
jgi:hypothetical protein